MAATSTDRAHLVIDQWLAELTAAARKSVTIAIAGAPRQRLAIQLAKEIEYQQHNRGFYSPRVN